MRSHDCSDRARATMRCASTSVRDAPSASELRRGVGGWELIGLTTKCERVCAGRTSRRGGGMGG